MMLSKLLLLLCFRLCIGQADRGRAEVLPKPSLRAWPSSVVPDGSSVTLRCETPTRDVSFALRKGARVWEMVQSPDSTEGRAEFHLPDVKSSHAGEYTCEYHRRENPHVSARPSDALLLLVTGYLRQPSLQAHRRGPVTEGQEVTLQCQRPAAELGPVMFALLKAGSAAPVQVRARAGRETDFSLRNLSAGDSGNYSCVYYQARAPFRASLASPRLEIRVAASLPSITSDYTTGNHIRLALAAVIMVIAGAFLLEAWCRQRHVRGESDNHKDCSGVSLHLTRLPQPLIAGMYLMMSVDTVIPPGGKVVNSDISCHYKKYPMHVFAYRVHTHHLGKVVSGYRVRNGQWTLIGRQSPQLPQAFYPVERPVDVSFGDILAARCVFTGEGRTEVTHIGGTSSDEMCNLYIMYYMEAKHAVSFMTCTQNVAPDIFRTIPPEANIPIPVKSDMVMMHGHHKETENKDKTSLLQQPKREEEGVLEQGDFYSLLSKLLGEREDVVHVHKYNPTEKAESESDLVAEIANVVQKKDLGRSDTRESAEQERGNAILVRDRIHKFHRLVSTLRPAESRVLSLQRPLPGEGTWEPEHTGDFHVEEALDWPGVYLLPGQVSGVALDPQNNLVIFHRGDHVWDGNSFDSKFVYQQRGLGPIEEDTILVIDPNNAAVLQSSGKNLFYLPHGLSIDKDGNYWVTDVALHQVFKLDPKSKEGPLLTLGRSMQPGSDQNHFCQPTDVAVDPDTGTIYVSDGYCNSRLVQFSPSGKFITQWGEASPESSPKPGQFRVPHSLALVPPLGQLCVADRENGRIQCFKTDTKEFVREIKHPSFGRNVFAISYIPGLLFAVNGKPYFEDQEPVQGFVMNFSSGEIIDVFKPVRKHFDMPHDIAASEDGTVYVGDAHTNTVWKFTSTEKMEHRSVKKAGIEVQEIKESEAVVETKMENKPASSELQKIQEKQKLVKEPGSGVPAVLITTLLVIPVVVLLAIALFIRWKKSRAFGDSERKLEASSGRVLGRLRGKGGGGLNLGNFFASRKGYSRKGFDRLSTEGSDQEKDEDASESEEEYSAPPPAPAPSS